MLYEEYLPSDQGKSSLVPQHESKNHVWQVAHWKFCLELFPSGLLFGARLRQRVGGRSSALLAYHVAISRSS